MKIEDRTIVSKTWHPGFSRQISDIEEIVIHGTGGGQSAKGLMKWMQTEGRPEDYNKGIALFHYLVDRDGSVFQIGLINKWYYHSSSGQHDRHTIGIELMNPDSNNEAEFTDQQYQGLIELISDIFKICKIKTIAGHGYNKRKYSGGTKNCPGNFNWNYLYTIISPAFSDLKTDGECIYNFS